MAAQVCRPCCSGVAVTSSASRVRGNPASFLAHPAWYRARWRPGKLQSGPGDRTLRMVLESRRMVVVQGSSSSDSPTGEEKPGGAERLGQVLKVIAPLVPMLLLGVGPVFASTVAVKVTEGTAKGIPELITSAWTGLVAGCLHTLTGPDHLAALAPLSIGRTKIEGAVVGALWGCGHDAGQIIFGLLFLLLKERLHIDLLRTWSARVVGVTLLAIGGMGIKEAQEAPVPCIGEDCEAEYESASPVQIKKPFGFATFITGVVHGLQPDALLVILPALALPSRVAGVAFLFMFLLGTVLAMASYTAFVGSCSEALKERVPWITQRLTWGSSLIAIAVGISILVGEVFGINIF